jgi:hypothetical protein
MRDSGSVDQILGRGWFTGYWSVTIRVTTQGSV